MSSLFLFSTLQVDYGYLMQDFTLEEIGFNALAIECFAFFSFLILSFRFDVFYASIEAHLVNLDFYRDSRDYFMFRYLSPRSKFSFFNLSFRLIIKRWEDFYFSFFKSCCLNQHLILFPWLTF